MIYLSAAYHLHHPASQARRRQSFGQWLGDSGVAIGTWLLVGVGVLAAVLPIWV